MSVVICWARIGGALTVAGAAWLTVLLVAAPLPGEAWATVALLLSDSHGASTDLLPALVLGLCAAVALLATTWWLFCFGLCLAHEARRERARSLGTVSPRQILGPGGSWLRPRSAQILAGLLVGGLSMAPTAQADVSGAPVDPADPAGARVVAGLRVPDRAETPGGVDALPGTRLGRAPRAAGSAHHVPPQPLQAATHTVRPGDSLWSIAATRLAPTAPPAAVDRTWRRLYALNRSHLGPDPDLIRPGVVLTLPSPPHARTQE